MTWTVATLQEERYFAGRRLMPQDRLGSVADAWLMPYGTELFSGTKPPTANNRVKFATYYRDEVTGDYADQRYYLHGMGRFLTVDPAEPGDLNNPNSWNFYSYVVNDPINLIDPEGLEPCRDIPVGSPSGPRLSGFLNTDTEVGLLAVTIFVESAMRATQQGAEEMGAIGSVIMNRYNIVNGNITMLRTDGTTQRPPMAWGVADGTLRSIVVNPTQFEVWQGPGGTLTPAARSRLDRVLNAEWNSDLCKALLNATGTAASLMPYKDTNTRFVDVPTGLMFTGFNSFTHIQKYDWEQEIGQFGSANRFYGVPSQIPVPRRTPRPWHNPRR